MEHAYPKDNVTVVPNKGAKREKEKSSDTAFIPKNDIRPLKRW